MSKQIFLFCLLLLTFYSAQAQLSLLNDSIQWESDYFLDTGTQDTVSIETEFITCKKQCIQWLQNGGEYKLEFKIRSVSDDWETSGITTYLVSYQKRNGAIRFARLGDNTCEINFDFPEDGKNSMPYKFHVSTYFKR